MIYPGMSDDDSARAVQHRFMNDLNLVHSLLGIAERKLADHSARRSFASSRARVRAVALAHRAAWQATGAPGNVSAQGYFEAIAAEARRSLASPNVELLVRVDPVELSFERALAAGLVARELVANALEHAFPDGRRGRVLLAMSRQSSRLMLCVEDDGKGTPAGHEGGVGLSVVELLAEQLAADLRFRPSESGGTRVELEFPMNEVGE